MEYLCFLAATKQLYEWFSPSVCPSITPFWLCSHHRITMKFSGVFTNDRSDVHAKGQDQRSKVTAANRSVISVIHYGRLAQNTVLRTFRKHSGNFEISRIYFLTVLCQMIHLPKHKTLYLLKTIRIILDCQHPQTDCAVRKTVAQTRSLGVGCVKSQDC